MGHSTTILVPALSFKSPVYPTPFMRLESHNPFADVYCLSNSALVLFFFLFFSRSPLLPFPFERRPTCPKLAISSWPLPRSWGCDYFFPDEEGQVALGNHILLPESSFPSPPVLPAQHLHFVRPLNFYHTHNRTTEEKSHGKTASHY